MATSTSLPREIVKWLQSLDLSFSIKNPKRDLTNGYVVAEIMSRHHPKDVHLTGFENGTRLSAKVDNWEQLYKLFRKKGLAVTKDEIDRVIHCAPGAALAFLLKLYSILTGKNIDVIAPVDNSAPLPPFMRDTASRRLKDHEIDRIYDKVEKTICALNTLGYYHEERRAVKAAEAPLLLKHERKLKAAALGQLHSQSGDLDQNESAQIDEVAVKAMSGSETQLQRRGPTGGGPPQVATSTHPAERPQRLSGRARLLQAVSQPRTSAGALASLPQPAPFVKPSSDIMRPLVYSIIQESEELAGIIDPKKDIIVSFMEQCRQGLADDVAVRLFETIGSRSQMLIDTLTKSAPEFWKVWSTFSPALLEFPETSPVFASAVLLFQRLGEGMREIDPQVTQQLITEVGLPSLCKELVRSPEKRESICRIIYSFTQMEKLNHLVVLRAIKEKLDDTSVYVSVLASLVGIDAEMGLLDEHLLDLYIYYALIAMQSSQPKIRVAGLQILSTITTTSAQQDSIVALIPVFSQLAGDEWWEVQAQVLLLAAKLLGRVVEADGMGGTGLIEAAGAGGEAGGNSSAADAVDSPSGGAGEEGGFGSEPQESLLAIISRLFVVSNSKNVLQVGLCALVDLLPYYTNLLPMFVAVLLAQPAELRRALLLPTLDGVAARTRMVWGTTSLMYEEVTISQLWPHLDVAKTFAKQLEANPLQAFEPEHIEVFQASLPETFQMEESDEWVEILSKLKQYVFDALVDPRMHINATQVIKRFWCCPSDTMAAKSIDASKRAFLHALRMLYSDAAEAERVDEAAVLAFLRELRSREGPVSAEVTNLLEAFRETHPAEYQSSQLDTVFA
eukprot:TRINITY_DN110850_c0_g1_i1.p1 TRINITY_DN110850_c0_g1~~TRINITY_DN110850_c0_g1_i1.p1  ORF type:complete len:845 (+),score=243.11 TRINITY_DN110850_c0_g1_i1:105-2639(+)